MRCKASYFIISQLIGDTLTFFFPPLYFCVFEKNVNVKCKNVLEETFPFLPTSGELSEDYSALLFYFSLLWALTPAESLNDAGVWTSQMVNVCTLQNKISV